MKKALLIFFTVIVVIALFFFFRVDNPFNGYKLHITGDASTAGAFIYLDGKEIGMMEKVVDSSTGEIFSVGVANQFKNTPKENRPIYDQVSLPKGKYQLIFISTSGNKKTMDVNVSGEEYIDVSFEQDKKNAP